MDFMFHSSLGSTFLKSLWSTAIWRTAERISPVSFRSHSRSENQSFTTYLIPSEAVDKSSPSLFLTYWSTLRLPAPATAPSTSSSNSRRFTLPLYSFRSFSPRSVSKIQAPRPFRMDSTFNSYCPATSVFQSFILIPSISLLNYFQNMKGPARI